MVETKEAARKTEKRIKRNKDNLKRPLGQCYTYEHLNHKCPRRKRQKERSCESTWGDNSWKLSQNGEGNSHPSPKIVVGDFNISHTPKDRSAKQEISKETQTLNYTMGQLDLIGICRAFHPKPMEFIFFSSVYGTFSRIDYILGHKSSLGKF